MGGGAHVAILSIRACTRTDQAVTRFNFATASAEDTRRFFEFLPISKYLTVAKAELFRNCIYMPRSDSEYLDKLLEIRDAIQDALLASAGSADVIRYQIGTREVERSRLEAGKQLEQVEADIAKYQRRVSGPARNYLRIVRG